MFYPLDSHRAPQFCFLSAISQYHLLLLMINQRYRLPSRAVRDFVAEVKPRICSDPWCTFLLHRLELDFNDDMKSCCQNGKICTAGVSKVCSISRMGTALSPAMLQKVQGIAETLHFATGASQLQGDSTKDINFYSLQLEYVGTEPFNFDGIVDPLRSHSFVQDAEEDQEDTTKCMEVDLQVHSYEIKLLQIPGGGGGVHTCACRLEFTC